MAGIKPSFVTGANAKIKLAGKTFAYASDVSLQIQVDTIAIETMGRYEPVTNEPIAYAVGGDLSIVRYTSQVGIANNGAGGNMIPSAKNTGNGLGNVEGIGGSSKLSDHMNPGNLIVSTTFDIDVYQKVGTAQANGAATVTDTSKIFSIKDCRFRSMSTGLNKRNILVERYSFVGVLADNDSFTAYGSGDTDLV